ncbi:MAG: DUF5060 domain-containing protein, partial [Victivallales bacterium]|nr:DUF5060 domain-containing protein [Victivallales bacterium]
MLLTPRIALLLCLLAPALLAGLTFGFEGRTLPRLTSYKEAAAALRHASEARHGARAAELTFSFPDPAGYVGLMFAQQLPRIPARFAFDLHGDGNQNLLCLRFHDATGESFQLRLGKIGWHGWQRISSDLKRVGKESHWGGNNDGVVDLPVTGFGIEIRSFAKHGKCRPNGRLLFDNLVLDLPEATLPVVSQDSQQAHCPVTEAAATDRSSPIVIEGVDGEKATIWLNLTADSLHIAAEVTDGDLRFPAIPHDPSDGDAIEIWLDPKLDSLPTGLGQPDDCMIALHPGANGASISAWHTDRTPHLLAASRVTMRRTGTGYTLEAAIPRAALREVEPGNMIGFDACWWDQDEGQTVRHSWANAAPDAPWEFGILALGDVSAARKAASQAQRTTGQRAWLAAQRPQLAQRPGPPEIHSLRPIRDPTSIPAFGLFELACELGAEYNNPFDFRQIEVQAKITCPDGRTTTVDGFWFQPYRYQTYHATESLTPQGQPHWRIRFTPTVPGQYHYQLQVRDGKERRAEGARATFTCVPSPTPGFVRRSPRDPRYLEFDTGRAFFGIGFASHFWNTINTVLGHKHYFGQLAALGGNYTSINLDTVSGGSFSLDTGPKLGLYNLLNAAKLDLALEAARKRGIHLIPCLNQTALAETKHFKNNRFNAERGGPCKTAAEYFSNPEAVRLVKQRIRYTLARWGYSPNILAFELFNEVNYTDAYKQSPDLVRGWHADLAAFLATHDPNDHLVTTCFGSGADLEDHTIWQQDGIDAMVTHIYGRELVPNLRQRLLLKRPFGKPNIGGEIGQSWPEADRADQLDPDGVSFHNALWTSMAGGSAATVLHWWPFRYLDPGDHYDQMRPLAAFCEGIDWPGEQFQDLQVKVERPKQGKGTRLATVLEWQPRGNDRYALVDGQLWVTPDRPPVAGVVREADADFRRHASALPGLLFGSANPKLNSQLELALTCRQPGTLRIVLGAVAPTGTTLAVAVGKAAARTYPLVDRDGQANPAAAELKQTIDIPLPAGDTTVTLRNTGAGWLSLREIVAETGTSATGVLAFGLAGKTQAILWIHDRQNSWYARSEHGKPKPITDATFTLANLPPGPYEIEWWDTQTGRIASRITSDQPQCSIPT